jgi:plastocyanin
VNADGSARAGVSVRLFASGGATATATQTTGGDGRTTFENVAAGSHAIEVEPPTGFEMQTGEDDRKNVSVTAGSTTNVSFGMVTEDPGNVLEITLSGTSFSDADVTIAPGTTIRWINQDGMLHTVTPDGHTAWTSTSLGTQGATFQHTFTAAGTYAYYCQPHQSAGMTGVIRVQ